MRSPADRRSQKRLPSLARGRWAPARVFFILGYLFTSDSMDLQVDHRIDRLIWTPATVNYSKIQSTAVFVPNRVLKTICSQKSYFSEVISSKRKGFVFALFVLYFSFFSIIFPRKDLFLSSDILSEEGLHPAQQIDP